LTCLRRSACAKALADRGFGRHVQGLRKTAVSGLALCMSAFFLHITCTAKTDAYCIEVRTGAVARKDTQTEIIAGLAAAAHIAIVHVRIEFSNASRTIIRFKTRFKLYLPLIKSRQTGLLLFTGFTGYVSARCPVLPLGVFIGLMGSLFLAISGSTVLNMVFDRDIDARMKRTEDRPLPAGKISVNEALYLGLTLCFGGLVWSFLLSFLYGMVVFSGIFADVVIYTIWLKRKTAWSIVWGGISGGMPILAGRALGLGQLDIIGGLLSVAVLLWIPTHIVTFSMKYHDDYRRAGIPTFPSTYGYRNSRLIIAFSTFGASVAICLGIITLGLSWGYLGLLAILTVGMLGLAIAGIFRPSERVNFRLFKYASLYMLSSMSMVVIGVLA